MRKKNKKIYDKIIYLDDKEFVVEKEIVVNNINYIYATLLDNEKVFTVLKETYNNNEIYVESIDETTYKKIKNLFK